MAISGIIAISYWTALKRMVSGLSMQVAAAVCVGAGIQNISPMSPGHSWCYATYGRRSYNQWIKMGQNALHFVRHDVIIYLYLCFVWTFLLSLASVVYVQSFTNKIIYEGNIFKVFYRYLSSKLLLSLQLSAGILIISNFTFVVYLLFGF